MKQIVLTTLLLAVASNAYANSFTDFFTKDIGSIAKTATSQKVWNPKNNGLNKAFYGHSNPNAWCKEKYGENYLYQINARKCKTQAYFDEHQGAIGID